MSKTTAKKVWESGDIYTKEVFAPGYGDSQTIPIRFLYRDKPSNIPNESYLFFVYRLSWKIFSN